MGTLASGSIDLKSLKVAGEPNKYVTMVNGSGIRVHEAGALNTNFVQINSNGLQIYRGGETTAYNIADFSDTAARIGKISSYNTYITNELIALRDGSTSRFSISNTAMNASLAKTGNIFTIAYAESNPTHTERFSTTSTSGTINVKNPVKDTNMHLEFVVFFDGYDEANSKSVSSEEFHFSSTGTISRLSPMSIAWSSASSWHGEQLPSGSITVTPKNIKITTNTDTGDEIGSFDYTITCTGPTFASASIIISWETSDSAKDEVYLTFGTRNESATKGLLSTTFGSNLVASGDNSYAGGFMSQATNTGAFAYGKSAVASGECSIALGNFTEAAGEGQMVIGKYNIVDDNSLFIIGNGADDSHRSNLFVINSDGNLTIHGKGDTDPYFKLEDLRDNYGRAKITETYVIPEDENNPGTPLYSNYYTLIYGHDIIAVYLNDTELTTTQYSCTEQSTGWCVQINSSSNASIGDVLTVIYYGTGDNFKSITFGSRQTSFTNVPGPYSIAMGENVVADGSYSSAFGYQTSALGWCAHAEGDNTRAEGADAHAEGSYTYAKRAGSHAEGSYTVASGIYSHAEGLRTVASGSDSHAEGLRTIASGSFAHAQNYYTIATEASQTVIGKFNKATVSGAGTNASPYQYSDVGNYAFIIGNGTANTTAGRSNALAVDWNGNTIAQGMIGQIIMYGGTTAPNGWLMCDGSAVSRTTYAALFNIIGTTYGAGDGSTTFNLPNFCGRMPVGVGQSSATGATNHTLAQMDGSENTVIPSHSHSVSAVTNGISGGGHTHQPSTTTKSFLTLDTSVTGVTRVTTASGSGAANMVRSAGGTIDRLGTTNSTTHTHNLPAHNTDSTGTGDGAGTNMPPYLGINFIIHVGIPTI